MQKLLCLLLNGDNDLWLAVPETVSGNSTDKVAILFSVRAPNLHPPPVSQDKGGAVVGAHQILFGIY